MRWSRGAKVEWPDVSLLDDELNLIFDISPGAVSTIALITPSGIRVTGRSYYPASHPRSYGTYGFQFEMNSVDPILIRSAIQKNSSFITLVFVLIRSNAEPKAILDACVRADLEVGLAPLEHTRDPSYLSYWCTPRWGGAGDLVVAASMDMELETRLRTRPGSRSFSAVGHF